jgi:CBS domain-containing protein
MSNESLTAADVMHSGIKSVPPQMTIPELEEAFVREQVSGFPVVDEGEMVGLVSRADVVRHFCTERRIAETVSDFHFDEKGFHEIEMESMQQIADRVGERIEGLSVADVMNKRPLTVSLGATIREVAEKCVHHHIHRLPVTDQGTLVGIITTIDLARLIADGRFVQPNRQA